MIGHGAAAMTDASGDDRVDLRAYTGAAFARDEKMSSHDTAFPCRVVRIGEMAPVSPRARGVAWAVTPPVDDHFPGKERRAAMRVDVSAAGWRHGEPRSVGLLDHPIIETCLVSPCSGALGRPASQ